MSARGPFGDFILRGSLKAFKGATMNAMAADVTSGMGAVVLDGKTRAAEICAELRNKVAALAKTPVLQAVVVGDDPASAVFVKEKERAAVSVGIEFKVRRYSYSISSTELSRRLHEAFHETRTDGIIIQLPLPEALDRNRHAILRSIPEDKDVDCLSEQWLGRMQSGRLSLKLKKGEAYLLPPVAGALQELLQMARVSPKAKRATVVGWGDLVGKPCASWLLQQGATVIVLQETESNMQECMATADIVVSGTGQPGLIRGGMIKPGAVVIDAGFALRAGKNIGDIDVDTVRHVASYFSPVPGGVGPLTVAQVLKNVVSLTEARFGLSQ